MINDCLLEIFVKEVINANRVIIRGVIVILCSWSIIIMLMQIIQRYLVHGTIHRLL